MIERVRRLLDEGVDPQSILMLTFTNKAADVMKERLEDTDGGRGVLACTFHSLSFGILRGYLTGGKERFTVVDSDDQKRILRNIINEFGLSITPVVAAEYINIHKSRGIVPIYHDIQLYGTYEDYLDSHNLMDFGNLQIKALDFLGEDMGYRHVLVDEFHDTSPVQMNIVRHLEEYSTSLTVVCDDQQSIYGWRGADIHNILQIRTIYPDIKIVHLERNYRSTKSIVQSINTLVSHAEEILEEKRLYSERKYGMPPTITSCSDELNESRVVASRIAADGNYSDHMVLMRTNGQSRAIENEFMTRRIPYKVVAATSFYSRTVVKDIVAYLRWIYNPEDEPALTRIVNKPRRRIGKEAIRTLLANYDDLCSAVAIDPVMQPLQDIREHMDVVMRTSKIRKVMDEVLGVSGYAEMIRGDTSEKGIDSNSNLDALLASASEFEEVYGDASTLEDYLRVVTLLSDSDGMDDDNAVNILTIHSSKGLECRNVHIIGAEEMTIPHFMSVKDQNVEEERRLMYVAVSRGMDTVNITWCQRKILRGRYQNMRPSRFLRELGV